MSIAGRYGWRWYAGAAVVLLALVPVTTRPERTGATAAPTSTAPASPTVRIVSPSGGVAIGGNVAFLRLASAPPKGQRTYVLTDRDPPPEGKSIPVAHGIVWTTTDAIAVPGLTVGVHRLTAVFGDALRTRLAGGSDSVIVTAGGPQLIASAPGASVEGDPWTIIVNVTGVRLVAPNGDTSRATGHLEFVIDHDLPPVGIPLTDADDYAVPTAQKTVPLTGLETGEHYVWIVLADGARQPFYPYVADLVRVTVTM